LAAVPGSIQHLGATPSLEWSIGAGDGILAYSALLLAYFLYGPKGIPITLRPHELGDRLQTVLFNAFYIDWLYQKIVANPYRSLARFLWIKVDEGGVDAGMVGYGKGFGALSAGLRLWTTGRLSTYLRMLLLGFTVIICAMVAGLFGS
jgi:NADH:ubiquinone oxidoreductase subunit 5 (subunit L)/multisubunit Na+/H+ antiporter MnhA subunit